MEECNPMEVLFTRRCAKFIYVVPDGLRELMSDITREVLRCNPKEIYCFIADYLEALFISRENAKVAALFVEDVTETGITLRDIFINTNLTFEQAVRAVKIIQRAFRRYLERKKLDEFVEPIDPYLIICKMMLRLNITFDTASQAARIIQQAWRCYKLRMDLWRARFQDSVDWREAARYTLRMYKKYTPSWEYTRAVTLIQAAYRGYYTRRFLRNLTKKKKCPEEDVIAYLIAHFKPIEEYVEHDRFVSTYHSINTNSQEGSYNQEEEESYGQEEKSALIIQKAVRKYWSQISGVHNISYESVHPDNIVVNLDESRRKRFKRRSRNEDLSVSSFLLIPETKK